MVSASSSGRLKLQVSVAQGDVVADSAAMAESFFATLEREMINRRSFKSQAEARMAIFQRREGWYNPHRRHSALGYLSPINYERTMMSEAA